MCFYANAFIAGKDQDSIVLPKNPEGLQVTFDGELQPSFSQKFGDSSGVLLVFHDGHCLCNYKDWKTLFEHVESIRQANDVDKVPLIVFFTGEDYSEINTIEVDLELDDTEKQPKYGMIMYVGISIERRLTVNVGNHISILFKNGKTVTGTLSNYQIQEQYGEIVVDGETIYFNADEIRHVDAIL
ncbi:MAG: hypothetical protein ACXABH_02570 [Candidatus Thorarchaeota archaeon]